MEFDHSEIYSPVDLKVGKCRLSVAGPKELAATEDPMQWSHLRIATKYPNITKRYFAARGVQGVHKTQWCYGTCTETGTLSKDC